MIHKVSLIIFLHLYMSQVERKPVFGMSETTIDA